MARARLLSAVMQIFSLRLLPLIMVIVFFVSFAPRADSHNHDDSGDNDGEIPNDIDPIYGDDYWANNPESGNDENMEPHCAVIDGINTCVVDNADGGTDPPVATPTHGSCIPTAPSAPAPKRVETAAALPVTLGVNPHERGLTGLETWLWVNDAPGQIMWTQVGSPGVDEDCTALPAPSVRFTAVVESWEFQITGEYESATYASEQPGSEAEPAAAHTFEYVDFYDLELTAELRGDLNGEVLVDRFEYEVIEVHSQLTQ